LPAHLFNLDRAAIEPKRVAEGNQLVSPFRRHHARNDGGIEYGSLLRAMTALAKCERHVAGQTDTRFGNSDPTRHFLSTYIDHGWPIAVVEMRET